MSWYVLDTDTMSLLERNHAEVLRHFAMHPPESLAVTVITVEEKLTGWYSVIRQAKKPEQLLRGYSRLAEAVDWLKALRVLRFSSSAFHRYEELRSQFPRSGKMDLYIAAIVLEANATMITRNTQDFLKIPGLTIQDWSKPD